MVQEENHAASVVDLCQMEQSVTLHMEMAFLEVKKEFIVVKVVLKMQVIEKVKVGFRLNLLAF